MKTICELNHDRYVNRQDSFSLQQVSIVPRVGMAIPFHVRQ